MLTEDLGHYLRAAGEQPLCDAAVHQKGRSELLDKEKGGGDGGTGGREKGADDKAARPVAKVCTWPTYSTWRFPAAPAADITTVRIVCRTSTAYFLFLRWICALACQVSVHR